MKRATANGIENMLSAEIVEAKFEYNKQTIKDTRQHLFSIILKTNKGILDISYNFMLVNNKITRSKKFYLNNTRVTDFSLTGLQLHTLEKDFRIGFLLTKLFGNYNTEEELEIVGMIGRALKNTYKGVEIINHDFNFNYHVEEEIFDIDIRKYRIRKLSLVDKLLGIGGNKRCTRKSRTV